MRRHLRFNGKWSRSRLGQSAAIAAGALIVGCAGPNLGQADGDRHCSDLVARALTSSDSVVTGAFPCMSPDERNFWHRWAISRDDQIPAVVRDHGFTSAGMVDGYDPIGSWTSATFEKELEPNRYLYLVQSGNDPKARAVLVIATDGRGRVNSFTLQGYDI